MSDGDGARSAALDGRSTGVELARRTRAAQGLAPTVDDPAAVAAIAAVAAAALRRSGRRRHS